MVVEKDPESVNSSKVFLSGVRNVSVFLIALVALLSVFYAHFLHNPVREHKCKATQSKSAEPASSRYPPDAEVPLPPSPSPLHAFQNAAVCSDSDICSNVGRDILHCGGNAVDSALATLACNGLVTMQSMGIGGGFIMNVFLQSMNKSFSIIARETAPLECKIEQATSDPNLQGPMSIAVPAEVMGYDLAHRRFGSLSWKRILEPTIRICETGWQLSKHQWDSLFMNPRVMDDTYLRKMFVNASTGGFNRVGSIIRPPRELCQTYRTLAERGPSDFYSGGLAKLVANDLEEIGSSITLSDLESYRAEVVESVAMPFENDVLHLVPPVGGALVVGHVLNILKGYDFSEDIPSVKMTHRIVEALKFGFAMRWNLGDPRFTNLKTVIENATSPNFGEQLRQRIDDEKTYNDPLHYGARSSPVDEHGTGHISVLAPNGDAVSVTSTIHFYFGSAHMGRRTGILFNNALGDFSIPGRTSYFSFPQSEANLIGPHKRPMSSMAPTIVTNVNGSVKVVVGGAGGPKIISALVNILFRMLWMGDDIKQAIDASRFHHQLEPNSFEYEYGVLKEVIDGLETRGHRTLRYRERGSAFCGIMKNSTAVYANVDFRKLGGVAGF